MDEKDVNMTNPDSPSANQADANQVLDKSIINPNGIDQIPNQQVSGDQQTDPVKMDAPSSSSASVKTAAASAGSDPAASGNSITAVSTGSDSASSAAAVAAPAGQNQDGTSLSYQDPEGGKNQEKSRGSDHRGSDKNENGDRTEMPEKPNYENEIIHIIRSITAPKILRDMLDDYHSYDIADTFSKLTPFEREKLYRMLDTEHLTAILEYLDEEDQAAYLNEMNIRKVISIINEMEADKAADLLKEIDREKREIIIELLEPEVRKNISTIFSYEEDEIGSKMTTNYIEVPRGITVKEAMRLLIKQAPENDNISTIYVEDENNMYYGAISLKELIIARPDTDLEEIITTSYPYVYASEPIDQVVEELKDYNEDSIPILNNDNVLLGVITAQDLLEVVDEEMGEDYARLAGLAAEEDLEENLGDSLRKRLPWLVTLLFLGMLVSSVVSLFEGVVAQLTVVMAFQSLILGMSGNVGTQSLGVTIRVLMDESLTSRQKWGLVFKEVKVGFMDGLITGFVSFALLGLYIHFAKNYDWFHAYSISLCVGGALWASMIISSFTGTTIPIFFKHLGVDPAVASGPLITTVNDMVGVITYYGLAWIFLIDILHL